MKPGKLLPNISKRTFRLLRIECYLAINTCGVGTGAKIVSISNIRP